jgi:hypothetical protein
MTRPRVPNPNRNIIRAGDDVPPIRRECYGFDPVRVPFQGTQHRFSRLRVPDPDCAVRQAGICDCANEPAMALQRLPDCLVGIRVTFRDPVASS